ncbi:ATP phosphoribosyltransferase regulatory subunit [Bacillus thuringiensis]|nr:ATP phosphoribosyltransferase regulatory subunit [Bacillus thuringiensis]
MKSIESKIPKFFDILEEEVEKTNFIHNVFKNFAKKNGFSEMKTTMIELRERYLNATNVHYSKIFEVHRVKEHTKYALQADLAMSMSRFVADLPQKSPLKLIQAGTVFRDRIPNVSGYRREFQQILIGAWGIHSLFVDAEILSIVWLGLNRFKDIETKFIQITNHNIFNCIEPNLAEKIRFNDNGISILEQSNINQNDQQILTELFQIERITIENLKTYLPNIKNQLIQVEFSKILEITNYLRVLIPSCPIYFSLKDLHGTGHYSSLNYQVFIKDCHTTEHYPIADGGRIDDLCSKINKNDVPGTCMGIGLTRLSELLSATRANNRIIVLIDDKEDLAYYHSKIEEIRKNLNQYLLSIIPLKRKKWKQVFNNKFYDQCNFILLERNNIKVRSFSDDFQKRIEELLQSIHRL